MRVYIPVVGKFESVAIEYYRRSPRCLGLVSTSYRLKWHVVCVM